MMKTVGGIARFVRSVLIAYAVLFSIAMTAVLIVGAVKVTTPIRRVKRLVADNPAQSMYMKRVAEQNGGIDSLEQVFVPLDSISPHLIKAVLAAEDDGFYSHPGIDLNAITQAFEHNRRHNRIKHGGSTITQQTAKNFFVGAERSFDRKYRELAYALLMERYLGKDRILELYLNYAQWGSRLFGCEAAARHYFGKSCKDLSLTEACRLAAVLASPERLSPHHGESILLRKRLAAIANNLSLRRYIDDSTRVGLGGADSSPSSLENDSTGTEAQREPQEDPAEDSVETSE